MIIEDNNGGESRHRQVSELPLPFQRAAGPLQEVWEYNACLNILLST